MQRPLPRCRCQLVNWCLICPNSVICNGKDLQVRFNRSRLVRAHRKFRPCHSKVRLNRVRKQFYRKPRPDKKFVSTNRAPVLPVCVLTKFIVTCIIGVQLPAYVSSLSERTNLTCAAMAPGRRGAVHIGAMDIMRVCKPTQLLLVRVTQIHHSFSSTLSHSLSAIFYEILSVVVVGSHFCLQILRPIEASITFVEHYVSKTFIR